MIKRIFNSKDDVLFLFSITGIVFWFIIGFPFANRNESYSWVTQFEKLTFWESLTKTFPSIVTFRPIGQAISWLLYFLAGRDVYLIQLFNLSILLISFYFILKNVEEKHLISICLFINGMFFITSYYYIFHVHGIFYSLLILYVALLLNKSDSFLKRSKTNVFVIAITLLAIGIHTFSIIIFCLYLFTIILSKPQIRTKKNILFLGIVILATLVISKSASNYSGDIALKNVFINLKNSFSGVEQGGKLAPIVFILTLFSILGNEVKNGARKLMILLTITISTVILLLKIPMLFFLCAIIIAKLLKKKKYLLLSIILSLIIFPAIVESGSPTKSAMLLTYLCMAEVAGLMKIENKLNKIKYYWIFAPIILILSFSILTKNNYSIPILNKFTSPIQAEREKSIHLELIIKWFLESDLKKCNMILIKKANPVKIQHLYHERKIIPPTSQGYLDEYLNYKKGNDSKSIKNCSVFVTFGNRTLSDKKIVFQVFNIHAGYSRVFY